MTSWLKFSLVNLPSLASLVLTVATITFLYFLSLTLYNVFLHPLASYPGPLSRAASKLPYLVSMGSGYQHRDLDQLHNRYGPVVRIAPRNLSYITPQAWQDIYAHKKTRAEEMIKDPEYVVRSVEAPTIINGDHEQHARYRKLYAPGFSLRSLREQEPIIQRYVGLFIKGLEKECQGGEKAVDMVQWFNWVTFDIIGDLAFGEPFGCLERGDTTWLSKAIQIEEANMQIRVIQHLPLLRPFARRIVNAMVPTDAVKAGEAHLQLTREKVARRLDKRDVPRPDFMEHILQQPPDKGLSLGELRTNSATMIQAGSETTATLLSGATYFLGMHPDKMDKLARELKGAFPGGEGEMTLENTSRLAYLNAVLEESLRLYSPSVGGLPREVPEGGAVIDGRHVAGGSSVALSHYAAYHSPLNFSRAKEFIPERFIDLDKFPDDRRDVLQPFSIGPRNCIGQNLAYAEGRLILGRFVRRFDMRMTEVSRDWMKDQKGWVTWMRPTLEVYIKLRED